MEIHISPLPVALAGVGMIFGEDWTQGPQARAPAWLLENTGDQPIWFRLAFPAPSAEAVVMFAHKVAITHKGKKIGEAVRTDAAGLSAFRIWSNATAQAEGRKLWGMGR